MFIEIYEQKKNNNKANALTNEINDPSQLNINKFRLTTK